MAALSSGPQQNWTSSMDIFKLLARSTNIQKSGPNTEKTSKQTLPSTGLIPQNASGALVKHSKSVLPSKPEHRGTKRKRPSKDEAYIAENVIGSPPNDARNSQSINKLSPQLLKRNHDTQDVLNKSVVECKRILKQNKLKITVLYEGRPSKSNVAPHETRLQSSKKKDSRLQLYPEPLISFTQLRTRYGISKRLSENLDNQGYRYPTEVQLGSLPLLLGSDAEQVLSSDEPHESSRRDAESSHLDLLTVAPTGSGKTLAFLVHVIHRLLKVTKSDRRVSEQQSKDDQVHALIIAPTHELVDQIVNEGRKLVSGTSLKISAMRKGMTLVMGSSLEHGGNLNDLGPVDQEGSADAEPSKPRTTVKADILVSTPMYLVNAISEDDGPPQSLPAVRHLVLDEADVLLDPLFRDQTLSIWTACTNPSLQTTLWSATIGSSIESLTQSVILDRRRNLGITSPHYLVRVIVGLKDSAVPNVAHRLVYAATEQGKLLALRHLLHPTASSEDKEPPLRPPFLVFTQTIQRAIALHSELLYDISPEAGGSARIAVLHSDLSDTVRSAIMAGFRKGEIWVLVTTDLLSRGIDFRGMNGVVNYDIPTTGASYVHRVGRTGRQGREGGIAATLYTKEDIPYVKNIANVIAAGERAKGKSGEDSGGVQKWLLNALPDVSKKTKQQLKKRGVESRRAPTMGRDEKEKRRARISTRSGYDRKLEQRRKGASQRVRPRDSSPVEEDEWGGIED